jgi:hypothetical protein
MNTHEPQSAGDILSGMVDVQARTIRYDATAEYRRKQQVADHLIETLRQQRSEYIEKVRAGEAEEVGSVTIVSKELHHVVADRAILGFDTPPDQT